MLEGVARITKSPKSFAEITFFDVGKYLPGNTLKFRLFSEGILQEEE